MKKKIVILLALSLLFTTTASFAASGLKEGKATVALEKVDFSDVKVTASYLNVREGPATSYPSICMLEKGHTVRIIGKLGNWYAIYDTKDGHIGAVDGKYLNISASAVTASANVSKAAAKATASKAAAATASKTASKTTAAKTEKNAAASADSAVVPTDVTDDELALFNLVNKARKDAGVNELAFDKGLLKVARLKATDMVENSYFSHQSPTYGSPFDMMKQFDFTFKTAGENIAGNKSIEGAFKAWMSSDTHKKNILNTGFNYTGIGISSSNTYGKVLVQQFIGK